MCKTGTRRQCWWECRMVQPRWETVWQFFRKLNTELPSVQFSSVAQSCLTLWAPYDPAISLLGIYSERNENIKLHRNLFKSVHSSIIHNGQRQKQPKHPSNDERISKMSCIHTMEIIQQSKGMKCWDTLWHAWTLKTFAKWKKSDIKGHMLYSFIYMKCSG